MKLTIHRALSELKLIGSKIENKISELNPSGIAQKGKPVNNLYPEDEFISNAKEKYQSVTDLITRRNKIKSAIVTANGVTKVKIGDQEMTIADAINYKSVIVFKRALIDTLTKRHNQVKAKYNTENEKIHTVALENAKIMIGKEGDNNVKPTDEDVKNIVEPFVKRNELHLIDPLKVEELVEKLKEEVDNFEAEVDAVLSEVNATTFIEVD